MNDRLEAFRKRLRGPDREKTNWQFWIGSPTAWLALFLSSTTAFYTFLYHSDELRVAIIPGEVQLVLGKVRVDPPERFTFINSGSRPIAVLAADISVNQPDKGVPYPDCNSGVEAPLFLKLEETVVKPYDAVVKSTKLDSGESPEIELSDANRSLSKPLFVVCVTFKFVATEGPVLRKTIEISRDKLDVGAMTIAVRRTRNEFLIKRNMLWSEVGPDRFSP